VENVRSPDRAPIGTGTHYPDHVLIRPCAGRPLAGSSIAPAPGKGQYIELSQLESTVNLLGPSILRYSRIGRAATPQRQPAQGLGAMWGLPLRGRRRVVRHRDRDDAGWQALVETLGCPQWMSDARFETPAGRNANIDAIEAEPSPGNPRFEAERLVALLQAARRRERRGGDQP